MRKHQGAEYFFESSVCHPERSAAESKDLSHEIRKYLQGKVMSESVNIENKKQNRQKPPRNLGRIACEILAGAATASAVAVSSVYVIGYGSKIAGLGEGCMDGLLILGIMGLVVPPTYGLGSAVGVYLVGSRGNETGSFPASLGGGLLGLFVMALLYFYIVVTEKYMMLGIEKIIVWPLVFLAAPIFATLGFNLTRRYKEQPPAIH